MIEVESNDNPSNSSVTTDELNRIEYIMKNKDWDGWPKTKADIELLRALRKIPVNELYPLILCSVPSQHRTNVLGALVDRKY